MNILRIIILIIASALIFYAIRMIIITASNESHTDNIAPEKPDFDK